MNCSTTIRIVDDDLDLALYRTIRKGGGIGTSSLKQSNSSRNRKSGLCAVTDIFNGVREPNEGRKVVDEVSHRNLFIDKDFSVRKGSIDYLIKNFKDEGRTVFLIGPILTPEKEFSPEILSREIIFKDRKEKQFYKYQNLFDKKYEKVLEYYKKNLGKKFLLPHEVLCKQNKCFFANDEGSFFSDTNHLSKYGSLKMKKIFTGVK